MKMRTDVRKRQLEEVAKLAAVMAPSAPSEPAPAPLPKTNQSSGLFNLDALRAADPEWLDHAIDRAKARTETAHGGRPISAPRAAAPALDPGLAESLAPVASLAYSEALTIAPPPRKRRALLWGAAVLLFAGGAFALVRTGGIHRAKIALGYESAPGPVAPAAVLPVEAPIALPPAAPQAVTPPSAVGEGAVSNDSPAATLVAGATPSAPIAQPTPDAAVQKTAKPSAPHAAARVAGKSSGGSTAGASVASPAAKAAAPPANASLEDLMRRSIQAPKSK